MYKTIIFKKYMLNKELLKKIKFFLKNGLGAVELVS
jgi:hypothetical protein